MLLLAIIYVFNSVLIRCYAVFMSLLLDPDSPHLSNCVLESLNLIPDERPKCQIRLISCYIMNPFKYLYTSPECDAATQPQNIMSYCHKLSTQTMLTSLAVLLDPRRPTFPSRSAPVLKPHYFDHLWHRFRSIFGSSLSKS